MKRIRRFVSLTLLGGVTVVLPMALFALVFLWLFSVLADLVRPLAELVTAQAQVHEVTAVLLVLLIIIGGCFLIGLLLHTRLGAWFHEKIDHWLVKLAPGYRTIREIVSQFLGGAGDDSLLRGEPALARIYGADCPVEVTAIITCRHPDGRFTVFVPTAPIPTSGITYHLPGDAVTPLPNVSVEQAMRTIIACGAGSAQMLAVANLHAAPD